ncbi:hypothetical protein [Facklamia hominis]|uniref:hypothetical protein n=1 Tax=Facklamia hominis TaxID=178214 RepID=UPI0028899758|nr:hypothetical protein [Facklamia hominis]
MTLTEAKRCTPADFQIYSIAHEIKQEEQTKMIALQAWMNQSVQATKKVGKSFRSIYKSFDDFYDSNEQFRRIFNDSHEKQGFKPSVKERTLSLADKNRIINQIRKEENNG